jgi:hypothetical protein
MGQRQTHALQQIRADSTWEILLRGALDPRIDFGVQRPEVDRLNQSQKRTVVGGSSTRYRI